MKFTKELSENIRKAAEYLVSIVNGGNEDYKEITKKVIDNDPSFQNEEYKALIFHAIDIDRLVKL